MGYQVHEDRDALDRGVTRWAGYGVPAVCDQSGCEVEIDRGLGYKCEEHVWVEQPGDSVDVEHVDGGCGLYYCEAHRYDAAGHETTMPKPDTDEWVRHLLTDESWQPWREENPARVAALTTPPTDVDETGANHE